MLGRRSVALQDRVLHISRLTELTIPQFNKE